MCLVQSIASVPKASYAGAWITTDGGYHAIGTPTTKASAGTSISPL